MSLDHMLQPVSGHEFNMIARDQNNMHVQEPESRDQRNMHVPSSGPVQGANSFLTGYIDCAQEALWYLTQVENLPLDHPMVIGLQMHLWEQYKMLHLQQMLGNNLRMRDEHAHVEPVVKQEQLNVQCNNVDSKSNIDLQSAIKSESEENLGKCAIKLEALNAENDKEIPQTELRDVHIGVNNEIDQELSPEAQQVAEALAEEIYNLLNAENELGDDDFDEYSDDENDESVSSDEGFEEMMQS